MDFDGVHFGFVHAHICDSWHLLSSKAQQHKPRQGKQDLNQYSINDNYPTTAASSRVPTTITYFSPADLKQTAARA